MPLKATGKKTPNQRFNLWLNNKGQLLFQDSHKKWWIFNPLRYYVHKNFY